MHRVAICDDEPVALEETRLFLERFGACRETVFSVDCYESGETLLAANLEDVDVLLLDIGMQGCTGMEAARRLRAAGNEICLIFITTMAGYALEGYDVHAFGFLTKPLTYTAFARKMEEALTWIAREKGVKLALKSGTETDLVSSRDICYLDVLDHNVRLVGKKGTKSYYANLNRIEQQLEGADFFRCHKSFLVNFRAIETIGQDSLLMDNGDVVPLSKHRKKEFLAAFAKFTRNCL